MANTASFMSRQTHGNAAAPPSQTVLALTLPSTARRSLDPLWCHDAWASFVALRPPQQQQQMQIPFWPHQQQGSKMWPHSCQSLTWQTPRWPLGMVSPTPPTPRECHHTSGNRHHHHHHHGMRHQLGSWRRRSTRQRGLDGILAGKATGEVAQPPWTSRTAIRFRSGIFQEPAARLKP